MITEEKIRELLEKVSQQKENSTKDYIKLADKIEELRKEHASLISAIQTLQDLTQSDEIDEKIKAKTEELNNVIDTFNNDYKNLNDLERQIFSADGVVQTCLFILQEGEYAEENIEEHTAGKEE